MTICSGCDDRLKQSGNRNPDPTGTGSEQTGTERESLPLLQVSNEAWSALRREQNLLTALEEVLRVEMNPEAPPPRYSISGEESPIPLGHHPESPPPSYSTVINVDY